MLASLQRGIEDALFEIEDAARALLDALGDRVAVIGMLCEGFEDQRGERAAQIHHTSKSEAS